METVGQPGSGVDVEIPADGIGAKFLQGIEGVYRIALGFTHLLTLFILDMSQNDNILVRCFVKEHGGLCHQGVEPAAGLIHCLGNKLCRELLLK